MYEGVEKAVHFYFTNTSYPLYTAFGTAFSGKHNVSEMNIPGRNYRKANQFVSNHCLLLYLGMLSWCNRILYL